MVFAGKLKLVFGVVLLGVLVGINSQEAVKVEDGKTEQPVKAEDVKAKESVKAEDVKVQKSGKEIDVNAQKSVKAANSRNLLPVKTIAQQSMRTVKGVLKNPQKVKRPGRPLDSRFFGSKYGSLYKPEDFLSDSNSTSINATEGPLKSTPGLQDSISSPGIDNLKSVKGRKLPPQNYLTIKSPENRKLVEGVPLSAINLDETTETTTLQDITTEGTTVTEEMTEGTEIPSTMLPTEMEDVM